MRLSRASRVCADVRRPEHADNAIQNARGRQAQVSSCKTEQVSRVIGDKAIVRRDVRRWQIRHQATATTHAVVTGKFDSAYKIESKSTFEPPIHGKNGRQAR